MNKLIIFNDPALALNLREAGFAVFKQRYNGKECFATEENAELLAILPSMKQQYGINEFAYARSLHF